MDSTREWIFGTLTSCKRAVLANCDKCSAYFHGSSNINRLICKVIERGVEARNSFVELLLLKRDS